MREAFEGEVDEDVLEQVVSDIESEGYYWVSLDDVARANNEAELEATYLEAIRADKNPTETLRRALRETEGLLGGGGKQYLLRLLLVGVVSALEAFFLDFFVQAMSGSEETLRRFVEFDKDFGKRKVPVSDVFRCVEELEDDVECYLAGRLWHNLGWVVRIYRATLGIEFSEGGRAALGVAIKKRHAILHRGGQTEAGVELRIAAGDVREVVAAAREVLETVEASEAGSSNTETRAF